jgi:hypothetical protein
MRPLLRIATLAPGEIFGGAERQIMTLLRALLRRGLRSQLFTFHDAELAREARAAGIETQVLGARGLFDRESLRLLVRSESSRRSTAASRLAVLGCATACAR